MNRDHIVRIISFAKRCINNPRYIDVYLFCRIFGYSHKEYQYYHFERYFRKRFSFVSFEKCKSIFGKYNKVFTNKRDNYLLLGKYYKRDCCLLEAGGDIGVNGKLLRQFAGKHDQFIAKKFDGSAGDGVMKYESQTTDSWIEAFLNKYPEGCLLEEIIEQTPEIAGIHPQSTNTLRITTVNYGDHIVAIYPVMRFGTGNDYRDNSRDGLYCAIDEKSGKIISAINIRGEFFNVHPDTNLPIVGFQVPELTSAMEQAIKLAGYFPQNVFTGFDFAHTKDGWILLEANTETRFTVWQLPYQKGYKKELKKIKVMAHIPNSCL